MWQRHIVAAPKAYREQEAKWCGSHVRIWAAGLSTQRWNECRSECRAISIPLFYPLKSFVICQSTIKSDNVLLQFLRTGWKNIARHAF
jgi:hypothetical protein